MRQRFSTFASARTIRPRPTRNASCARSPAAWAAISSRSTRTTASAAPRVATSARRSIRCAVMPRAGIRHGHGVVGRSAWPQPAGSWSAFLSELHALRIDLFLHQQGLDTTTPAGKAMFQMMGVFAEFERAMIQERVRAGLSEGQGARGKRLGRPRIAPELEKRIRRLSTSWEARRAQDRRAVWRRSRHGTADQPPFRRRKRRRGVAARSAK